MLVDTHCHLQLLDYQQLGLDMDQVVQNAVDHKVEVLLCVATHMNQCAELYNIADKYINVKITVGLHPNEEISHEPSVSDYVNAANHHRSVIAIGETGLDYYRTPARDPIQMQRFRNQIQAAISCNKPLIIHTRQARVDTLAIMHEEHADRVRGIMHCFTEDWDMARAALDLGFYISFSGIVTFNNARDLQEVARKVPLDRILIETDCPYLAPVPFRGKINQPAYVTHTAEFLAGLKGVDAHAFALQTTKNFHELFRT